MLQATAPDAAKDAEISGAPASFLVPALWALLQARKSCVNKIFSNIHKYLRASCDSNSSGTHTPAGLPNITGYGTRFLHVASAVYSGCVNLSNLAAELISGPGSNANSVNINIDASNSNKIYGSSNTVSPELVNLSCVIYLGK